ncbi:DNA modification methylase [uncultured Mediterranean phage uvDeep-CGR1-KM17-C101]|nr:DNA modification methylase [uncultured Mediterranean phage uvDeep-CGR1-KM17-C101]
MIETNKTYNENCLETMAKMQDGFIDLTVTSPPYDNLRTYNGYSFDFESIAKELYRVTKDGGVVVWIVGDATSKFNESGTSFKQALYFKELGFNLLDTMIYYKQNYAPAYPTLRRYANQFEYMFVFSKGRPSKFNPIQKPKVRNKIEKVAFRQKDGTLIRKTKQKGKETKDASNVWEYAVGGNLTGHPAVFPEQLAKDHIISWSNENDIVYDCFMGSGTTAKMAILNNRDYIGSEMSKEYCKIIEKRLNNTKDLFNT